jgi:hypothetical protein
MRGGRSYIQAVDARELRRILKDSEGFQRGQTVIWS